MTSFWRIMAPAASVAVMCSAVILWSVHKEKAAEQSLAEAASRCRTLAEKGDAQSQFEFGLILYEGRGVPRDYAEAFRGYHRAADQGNQKAQNNVGLMYYHGRGIAQDYAEAVRWYRKAAEQGSAKAQFNLGFMYYQGKGVTQDYTEAARWYRKAADQGDAQAQYELGYMYEHGRAVPQDSAEALNWYRKAADQGDALAQRALGIRTESKTARRARYIFLLVVSIAGAWLSLEFLLRGRSLRDWRQMTTTLLGILALLYVGLSLYGITHDDMRHSSCERAFYLAKGTFIGMGIILFLILLLTGRKQGRAE